MTRREKQLKAQLTSLFGVTQVLFDETENAAEIEKHIMDLQETRRLVKAQLKRTKELLEKRL